MTDTIDRFDGQWFFLSNFGPAPMQWQRLWFPTSEHAYNAGKTQDFILRYRISRAATPRIAKKRGRAVVLPPNWDTVLRYSVMSDVLRVKFVPGSRLARRLLDTGDAYLTEGNTWHDQHWGNCTCGRQECATPGQNHLGRMLMELRDDLRRNP